MDGLFFRSNVVVLFTILYHMVLWRGAQNRVAERGMIGHRPVCFGKFWLEIIDPRELPNVVFSPRPTFHRDLFLSFSFLFFCNLSP